MQVILRWSSSDYFKTSACPGTFVVSSCEQFEYHLFISSEAKTKYNLSEGEQQIVNDADRRKGM